MYRIHLNNLFHKKNTPVSHHKFQTNELPARNFWKKWKASIQSSQFANPTELQVSAYEPRQSFFFLFWWMWRQFTLINVIYIVCNILSFIIIIIMINIIGGIWEFKKFPVSCIIVSLSIRNKWLFFYFDHKL